MNNFQLSQHAVSTMIRCQTDSGTSSSSSNHPNNQEEFQPWVVQLSADMGGSTPAQQPYRSEENQEGGDEMNLYKLTDVWVEDKDVCVKAITATSTLLPCTILVHGYVTSEVNGAFATNTTNARLFNNQTNGDEIYSYNSNRSHHHPFLFIASVDVLESEELASSIRSRPRQATRPRNSSLAITATPFSMNNGTYGSNTISDTTPNGKPLVSIPSSIVPGGRIYRFLSAVMPCLTNQQLIGQLMLPSLSQNSRTVSKFIEHKKAIETIHDSSFDPSTESVLTTTTTNTYGNSSNRVEIEGNNRRRKDSQSGVFLSALSELIGSQLDRVTNTLTMHVRKRPEQAIEIVAQYRQALEIAIVFGSDTNRPRWTMDRLCSWHATLCHDLHAQVGQLRTNAVKVGLTTFRPPQAMYNDLQIVCTALNRLEDRLRNDSTSLTPGLKAALYASIVFFAIVDTHAFADGNGRLARIAAHAGLRRFGFDIPVALFATAAQRNQCTLATIMTRRNTCLYPCGDVSQECLLEAYIAAGAFGPLVELFLDRMTKTVTELTRMVGEGQRASHEEARAQAARIFREQLAQGTCLICYDNRPNISTLCCGKAAHMNCLAEWLVSNNTCPNCRGELPELSRRIIQQHQANQGIEQVFGGNGDEDINSTTYSDSSTTEIDAYVNSLHGHQREAYIARLIDRLSQMQNHVGELGVMEEDANSTIQASNEEDDTMPYDDEHYSTEETTPEEEKCRLCNNRAARDCQNSLCGRCCRLNGMYYCARHEA